MTGTFKFRRASQKHLKSIPDVKIGLWCDGAVGRIIMSQSHPRDLRNDKHIPGDFLVCLGYDAGASGSPRSLTNDQRTPGDPPDRIEDVIRVLSVHNPAVHGLRKQKSW